MPRKRKSEVVVYSKTGANRNDNAGADLAFGEACQDLRAGKG
jgi:hypothetical protein